MKATKQATLSATTVAAIGKYSSKKKEFANAGKLAVDGLYADGIKPEMMFAPKKDEDQTLYVSLEKAVFAGFTATVQALLTKDVKALNETQKTDRRYWQQQIGSGIKDLRNALARRYKPAKSKGAKSDGDKSDSTDGTASWESTKRKVLSEIITQAQKKKSSAIKDLPAFIKDLQSALARIPADA